MTLDSSGNLLVGNTSTGLTSDGINLHGNGTLEVRRNLSTAGSSTVAYLSRGTSEGNILQFYKDTTHVGSIGTKSGGMFIGSDDAGIFFNDHGGGNSDALFPYDVGTNTFYNGHVDIGGASNKFRNIHISGSLSTGDGVTFGDAGGSGTSTSNTLDSYERGTWTPVWTASNGVDYNVSGYQQNVGQYVRVGDYVFCNLYIQHTGPLSGGTNWLRLSGLPFASVSTLANLTAGSIYNWGGFTGLGQGDQMIFRTQIGTNQGYFQVTNGGTGRNVTQNDFGGALSFALSFSYRAS
jgi:hypothetical protein